MSNTSISNFIKESIDIKKVILSDDAMIKKIEEITQLVTQVFKDGRTVYWCGNGGSAADSQHLAGELSGRFKLERKALPSEALHVNTSFLTAVGNDYGFDHVYSRAVEAFCKKGDVLFCLSTSGNSPNIINAIRKAKSTNTIVIGLSGNDGGEMAALCDHLLLVPSSNTPRIQEAHIFFGHIICEMVEANLFA